MSRREELLELDEGMSLRKRELFEQEFMTSKPSLIRRIEDIVRRTEGQINRSSAEDLWRRRYLEAKLDNLREFRDCVMDTTLFECLDNWWCYEFATDSHGTSLFLCHAAQAEIEDNGHDEWLAVEECDTRLRIIETKCNMYTVDEFAEQRGVAPATIRVWIRRGKIRSALKTSSGWMVPEMAAPLERGFSEAEYEWAINISGYPEALVGIGEPGCISIRKSSEKGRRIVWYTRKDRTRTTEFSLSVSEAEKLELFLVGHPAVEYTGDREIIHQ